MVDLPTSAVRSAVDAEDDDDSVVPPLERTIDDPREGTAISMRPGETAIVRFTFKNDQRGTRTYVIDEDRSLEQGWIELTQDQVNITMNSSGIVSVRLRPPVTAEPGSYPFAVRTGPLGSPLTPCNLILTVIPTPAVRVRAKAPLVKVGPYRKALDFKLEVEAAGNTSTAYRIAVKDPLAGSDDAPRGCDDIYETPHWRYLFDREMGDSEAPPTGRAPQPVDVALKAVRKGIWWFGWKETHHFDVASVPVTDPTNGAKTENAARLTAVRWRIFPVPDFVMIPLLLLLLMLMSSGADNLRVTNAWPGDNGAFYILDKQETGWEESAQKPKRTLPVRVRWSAPFYSLLGVNITENNQTTGHPFSRGGFDEQVDVAQDDYGADKIRIYDVGPLLRSGASRATVHFVPLRTNARLYVSVDGSRLTPLDEYPISKEDMKPKDGYEPVEVDARQVTVDVPRDGDVRLYFVNTTPENANLRVLLWEVKHPKYFTYTNAFTKGSEQVKSEAAVAKVWATDAAKESQEVVEDTWEFVTTDATHQYLRIKLRLRPN